MRTISAFVALIIAAGAAAAKYTGSDNWSDPVNKAAPTSNTSFWSYYPNNFQCKPTIFDNDFNNCSCGEGDDPPCGPSNWEFYSFDRFQTCSDSAFVNKVAVPNQQTPINLDFFGKGYDSLSASEGRLKFSWGKCEGKVAESKGDYQIIFSECEKPFTVTVEGKTWPLWQIHFHGPSEHTVNGIYYPSEVHFVHVEKLENGGPASTTDKALVVGVFITPGKANSLFNVLTALDVDETSVTLDKAVNPYSLIPAGDKSLYHYQGSLTTPSLGGCQLGAGPTFDPRVNNIQWYVFKKAQTASVAQLAWLTEGLCKLQLSYLCMNNRPLQDLLPTTDMYSYGKK